MKKFKETLRCVLVALIITVPLYIMLYGAMINNHELAVNSIMSIFIWAPLVCWIDDKIDDKLRK